jgi:hypothetical protein
MPITGIIGKNLPCTACWLRFLPRLVWNCDPFNLHLPSSWNGRCEPSYCVPPPNFYGSQSLYSESICYSVLYFSLLLWFTSNVLVPVLGWFLRQDAIPNSLCYFPKCGGQTDTVMSEWEWGRLLGGGPTIHKAWRWEIKRMRMMGSELAGWLQWRAAAEERLRS